MVETPASDKSKRRIALFMNNLGAGGAEVSMLNLAAGLADRGYAVDLVLCRLEGPLLERVPRGVKLVELDQSSVFLARWLVMLADPRGFAALALPVILPRKPPHRLGSLRGLVRYLRTVRPDAMISALPTPNMLAVWARRLSRSAMPLVVSQRNALSVIREQTPRKWRKRYLPAAIKRTYAMADAIVAVSDGVADDLARETGLSRNAITTVYNPVVSEAIGELAARETGHPWLNEKDRPVIVTVGALIDQKDHATLIEAFARLRRDRLCRLIIVGEGKSAEQTRSAIAERRVWAESAGVGEDVDMPGFKDNPYPFMANADLFVLSSRFEGLPGVLIQALACGAPIVATDCPHGPREILADGRYGALVPVGDIAAMARAMVEQLDAPCETERQRRRAADFSVDRAVDSYLNLLDRDIAGREINP